MRRRIVFAAIAAAEWFALITQLVLFILGQPLTVVGVLRAMLLFVSFFTIISNMLLAIVCTALALGRPAWFNRPTVATATAVYITIVATVWFLLLRNTYTVSGLGLVVDSLMHIVLPPVYVIAWAVLIPKGTLHLRNVGPWLLMPLGYAACVGVRGAIDGWYPYPFLDVTAIGYPRAGAVVAVFVGVFWIVGAAFVGIDRWLATTSNPPAA